MKIAGIICEYNPFHKGHQRLFDLIRRQMGENTPIVCVMSGNYVQRGAPAAWDKYSRANAAVACGADLVLELPLTAVLQSAEGFARAGVEILTNLGSVTHLCFGSECGNISQLTELAKKMHTEEYAETLRTCLADGASYAAARQKATGCSSELMSQPNNILGLEYCLAIHGSGSPLIPCTFQRNGSYHAETPEENEPSATAIRSSLDNEQWTNYLPSEAAALLKDAPRYHAAWGERAFLAILRSMTDDQWEQTAHGSEGLWRKAMKAARAGTSTEEILQSVKSKRYPMTRIQRLLICAFLGITDKQLHAPLPYVRILASSAVGRTILRQAKEQSDLTLINPGETPSDKEYYRLETRASDLFSLFCEPDRLPPCGAEQAARISL